MSQAIDQLKEDHETIKSALAILDRMASLIRRNTAPDKKDIFIVMRFLSEFVDKCHHGKEEIILFPAMIEAGLAAKGGPIEVMLAEHAEGRNLAKAMRKSVDNQADFAGFGTAAAEYAILFRNHTYKEDSILFPMADKMIGPEI